MTTEESQPNASAYDDIVRRARIEVEATPAEVGPQQLEQFWGHVARGDRQARRRSSTVAAGLIALLGVAVLNIIFPRWPGYGCVGMDRVDVAVVLALPTLAVLLSLALLNSRSAGRQMLLRALLWSTALLGALASVVEPHVVPMTSAAAGFLCGGALLVLRRHGLEPERYTGEFAPVAHRGVLTLMMILAVADAQTLVSWTNGSYWARPTAGLCGLAMTVGIIGLSRLRLWGLLLNVLMNVGVAAAAWIGWLCLPFGVVVMISSTAIVQLLLGVLVLRSVRRGTPSELPQLARWGAVLLWVAVGAVMVASLVGLLLGPG